MFLKNKKHSAFTLIELLVVIAIIGILATLAVVYLQASRANARDAKRVADVKQIQTALELYNNNNMGYPESLEELSSIDPQNNYMQTIPTAPTPCDGDCEPGDNTYTYNVSDDRTSYTIGTCIGKNVSDLNKGSLVASPSGIVSLGSGSSGNPPGGTGSFNCGDNLIDSRDSQSYPTVQIGTQCWMAKNVNYDNGCSSKTVPPIPSGEQFAEDAGWCSCYNDDTDNCTTYGRLYQWSAAMADSTTEGAQGICPSGWHVPTSAELATFYQTILANSAYHCGENNTYVAKALASKTGWINLSGQPNNNNCNTINNPETNNTTGFNLLPSGSFVFSPDFMFYRFGEVSLFWSSSEIVSPYIPEGVTAVYLPALQSVSPSFLFDAMPAAYGFSVRCIQNL